jgi:hypothetical protein
VKNNFLPWINKKPKRPIVPEVRTPSVHFLGEQDGPVERDLKGRWHPILAARPAVKRAFLARALYAYDAQHVVLALCTGGVPDLELVEDLRAPYAALFSRDCPLDMAFVSPTQESQLAEVCAPFYVAV